MSQSLLYWVAGSSLWGSVGCFKPLPYLILPRAHEAGGVTGHIAGKEVIEAQRPQASCPGSLGEQTAGCPGCPVRLSTALASVEPHKSQGKGTGQLRPHSSFGEEPSLLTPGTPGGRGVTISASTAESSLGSWLDEGSPSGTLGQPRGWGVGRAGCQRQEAAGPGPWA